MDGINVLSYATYWFDDQHEHKVLKKNPPIDILINTILLCFFTIRTACIGYLEWFTKTKSKCSSPVGTAGLCGFVVLLLLLQHWSSQHICTMLGPYNSSPFKDNMCQAQNQCLNQRPQVSIGICSLGRPRVPILAGRGWWEATSKALSCEGPARL